MSFFLKRSLKMISYSVLVVAGVVTGSVISSVHTKTSSLNNAASVGEGLLVGIAHADVPMCGAYACGTGGASGASDGGGDCGDGGSGDDCN